MSDEGVHEIQLNGKQLVFMFMAVTVVAVVIFLCGVMVGRGVRAPRATELADAAIESPLDPTDSVAPAPSSTDGQSSSAAPDPTQDPPILLGSCERDHSTAGAAEGIGARVQEVKATAPAKTTAAEHARPRRQVAPTVKTPAVRPKPRSKDCGSVAKACGGERAFR